MDFQTIINFIFTGFIAIVILMIVAKLLIELYNELFR